jgi:hypothetical protein
MYFVVPIFEVTNFGRPKKIAEECAVLTVG